MSNNIKKIADIINSNIQITQLFEKNNALNVYNSWSYMVGEKIASHSRLIDIKNHIAVIETDHNGWAQQILLKKQEIIKKFEKKYAQLEVKNISIIISSKYEQKEPTQLTKLNNKNKELFIHSTPQNFPPELTESFKRLKKSIVDRENN